VLRVLVVLVGAGALVMGQPGTTAAAAVIGGSGAKPEPTGEAALLRQLESEGDGRATVTVEPVTGKVGLFGVPATSPLPSSASGTPAAAARSFAVRYGTLFGAPSSALTADAPIPRQDGGWTVRLRQRYRGLPVFGAELVVRLDASRAIRSIVAKLMPDLDIPTAATVPESSARAKAASRTARDHAAPVSSVRSGPASLAVFDPAWLDPHQPRRPRLVWQVDTDGSAVDGEAVQTVIVDALDGTVVTALDQAQSALSRVVCDNANDPAAGGGCRTVARTEGGPPVAQAQVNLVYDQLGAVYRFYSQSFGRDSIDGRGLTLSARARYCHPASYGQACPLANAFWSSQSRTMQFGDGYAFQDVTGHELTHGVTASESQLAYAGESGAINEALSDIFGEFTEFADGLPHAGGRWLIGEQLPGGAVRNMASPTSFGDPDRMGSSLFRPTGSPSASNDYGGVHSNSGVANKTAYLITDGGLFNGYAINGLGPTKAAAVFYEAATSLLTSTSNYRDLSNGLLQGCVNVERTSSANQITDTDCAQVKAAVSATEMNRTTNPASGSAMANRPECGQNALARNDDGSSSREVALPFPVNFFGTTRTTVFVNNNGNVTFGAPFGGYVPNDLLSGVPPIMAPLWADVDTAGLGSDAVTYGVSSDGKTFCVDWGHDVGVGYYNAHTDKLNRFRLLLEDKSSLPGGRPGDFDVVFEYDRVAWETGDASGGWGGLGGSSARVGYADGSGNRQKSNQLTGSGANGALLDRGSSSLIRNSFNSGQAGRYRFESRDGSLPHPK